MTQDQPLHEEERRLVTILFADLVGYTSVSEARDPELIQDSLNLCFRRLAQEIERYGGYVDKVVGDEIMALFGAPRAQEDDAGKAVAAAVAMLHALAELTPQLIERLGQGFSIRIGINTGLVVTGAVGPGGYTVTGDAVNVAARLEKATDPGTVLVGEATRRLARRPFVWGERQEFTVKGRIEPVVSFRVEGVALAPMRLVPAPSDTPFVGRREALERVRAAWHATTAGKTEVVQLVGEAGIGKTRLLAHLFREVGASAEQVLYTRADTPPRTFGPLLQLLPTLRDSLPAGFEERIEALARSHDTENAPDVEPSWLVDGLLEIVRRLSATAPVALVLDDMHRADRATVEIVEKLLPRIAGLPVLTLLLRQPSGRRVRRISEADSITIEPLDQNDARTLVVGVEPELPEQTVQEIVGRAGGNPLYLEMLALSTAAAPHGRVPESLQTAVVARIDELDETSRRVLREASVYGQSFYEEPLRLTISVSEGLYDSLEHLCQIGLLSELPDARHRGYQYRHALVQQVLYEGLLLRQRGELHRKAAEALELAREEGMEVEPEQLAYHYECAGDADRAAAYHLAAAERADHLRAPVEATAHRRAANQLLNMASLAGLYAGNGRPSLFARATAAALQALIAALLLLPLFVIVATHRPEANRLTLGLPFAIIDFNLSSIALAIVLGGLPLMVAGIIFTHLAVPILMRRSASPVTLVGVTIGGWLCGLFFVLLGYAALIGLLRLDALDDVSAMYVGGATLQLLQGNYSLLFTTLAGTLVVAIAWTALVRMQARGWARMRRSSAGPRQIEEGRRWAVLRQVGLLVGGVGVLALLLLVSYQGGVLPNGGAQKGLSAASFGGLLVPFGAMSIGGVSVVLLAGRRVRAKMGAYQLGLFGFEIPLLLALAFGTIAWFGMRQAVIVSANDVDTPGSVAPFDRAVSMFPDFGIAYYLRGERHLADLDFEAARADFDRAIELDPNFPASYLARGRVLIQLGELDAAAADGARVIDLRPDHPGGYAIRAWAEFQLGDTAAAGRDITVATKPLPKNAQAWDAYFVRCLALAAIQRLDDAEADCKRVLELNPGHIISLDQLAQIEFYRAGQATSVDEANVHYEQGVKYTTQIISMNSTSAVAYANRGEAYSLLGQHDKAEADLSRALALKPDYARSYVDRALSRMYLDRPDDALADATKAVDLYVQDAGQARASGVDEGNVYSTRMFIAGYIGKYQQAVDDANRLESINQVTPFVLTSRGLALLQLADHAGGMADFQHALSLDADYAPAYDGRGYAHFLDSDYVDAEADFAQAVDRLALLSSEEQAELHYHRALLFQAQGRASLAQGELGEASDLVEVPSVRRAIEQLRQSLGSSNAPAVAP